MGAGEKRKTFFHVKKPNVGTEVFLLSPNPSPLFKKSGVFCCGKFYCDGKRCFIICPYRKLGFLKKRGILLGSICPDGKLGFSRKAEYFVEGIAVKKATSL